MTDERLEEILVADDGCPKDLVIGGYGEVYEHRRELIAEVLAYRGRACRFGRIAMDARVDGTCKRCGLDCLSLMMHRDRFGGERWVGAFRILDSAPVCLTCMNAAEMMMVRRFNGDPLVDWLLTELAKARKTNEPAP